MIPSQMLKGIIEGCILKVISDQKIYGYEISSKLNTYGFNNVSEGTIYPLLLRLEKNKMIDKEYVKSSDGPKRKYFYITELGKKEIIEFEKNWNELKSVVDNVLKGVNYE